MEIQLARPARIRLIFAMIYSHVHVNKILFKSFYNLLHLITILTTFFQREKSNPRYDLKRFNDKRLHIVFYNSFFTIKILK